MAQKVLWGGCFEPKSTGAATSDFFLILGGPGEGEPKEAPREAPEAQILLEMKEKSWKTHKMHAEPRVKS